MGAAPGPRTTGASSTSEPHSPPPSRCPSARFAVCPPSLFCPSLLFSLSVLVSVTQEMPLSFKQRTQKQATLAVQPPTQPPQPGSTPPGEPGVEGGRVGMELAPPILDRQADSGLPPCRLPLGHRDTRHCTRPHHSQAGPQAGTHQHTSGQETLTHAPTGLPAGGTLSCQELQGSEHSWSQGTPGPDSGTKGRRRCGVRGPRQNLGPGASVPRAGLALGSVPLGASHVHCAVWAEKSCLGLSWGHSVLGDGGGQAVDTVSLGRAGAEASRTRTDVTCRSPPPRAADRRHNDGS